MCGVSAAQFFSSPEASVPLNSIRSVFDITSDGKLAVTLGAGSGTQVALIVFDPSTQTIFDSQSFGFGPLEVQLAQTPAGLRAFVLTSEGGPRRLWAFSIGADGKLTQIGSTQLTTSIDDDGSNLIISSKAQVGAVIVDDGPGIGSDLVTFSLIDGSIVGRIFVGHVLFANLRMAVAETDEQQTVVFLKDYTTIGLIDISHPAQPADLGGVSVPADLPLTGVENTGVAFSADRHYAFISEGYSAVAVVDLETRQIVSRISGSYQFGRISVYDNGVSRLLLLQC